jgi:hypothetical protein
MIEKNLLFLKLKIIFFWRVVRWQHPTAQECSTSNLHFQLLKNNGKTCSHSPQSVEKLYNGKNLARN